MAHAQHQLPLMPDVACSLYSGIHMLVEERPEGTWRCKACKTPRPRPTHFSEGVGALDVYWTRLLGGYKDE